MRLPQSRRGGGRLAERVYEILDVKSTRTEASMDSNKDRAEGAGHEVKGTIEEKVGQITNDPEMEGEGHRREDRRKDPEEGRRHRKEDRALTAQLTLFTAGIATRIGYGDRRTRHTQR